jgi:hypothetical protein
MIYHTLKIILQTLITYNKLIFYIYLPHNSDINTL